MQLDFLRRIESATFPLTVTDQQEVAAVEVLRGALLISATVAPRPQDEQALREPRRAIVKFITAAGRELLAKYGSPAARK